MSNQGTIAGLFVVIMSLLMISAENRASAAAIFSGFLYGLVGYFGMTVVNAGFSISNMLFWRFLIAGCFTLIFALPRIRSFQDSWRELLSAFLAGAVFYSCSTNIYFHSSQYIGTGLAMVIYFTFPAMVMFFNHFAYKQKSSRIYHMAILIILMGMFLFIDLEEIRLDLTGVALGILCALLYAGYIIASKKCKISAVMSTIMVSFGCAFSSLIFALIDNSFSLPTNGHVWANLVGIALISTAAPILLLLYSLKYLNSDKVSILSVLEPVFVVIFGVILLGEQLTTRNVLGVIIVLSGALLCLFSQKIELLKLSYQQSNR